MTNINRIDREAKELNKKMMGFSRIIQHDNSNNSTSKLTINMRLAKSNEGEEDEQNGEEE